MKQYQIKINVKKTKGMGINNAEKTVIMIRENEVQAERFRIWEMC